MPSLYRDPNCAAPRCPRLRVGFSRYCREHQYNLSHHGHPLMSRTSERLYKRHRARITAGLLRYSQSAPMRAACEIADQFLNYTATSSITYEKEIAEWARRARAAGVAAMDLLRTAAEFQAVLDESPHRFPDGRAERHALARRVLLLGPRWGTWRPRGRLLNNFGHMLKEALGTWAWAFLKRLDRDDEERRELRRRAADFDSIPTKAKRAD